MDEPLEGLEPAGTAPASGSNFKDHVEALLKRLEAHRSGETRYEELREIARGGMGVVVEVRDQDLRRRLALKRMHPKRTVAPDGTPVRQLLARFLQEAQVTGQLGHPGIPPIHELGVDEHGRAYFTMPLIGGSTLEQVFAHARQDREGWDVRRALGVLAKVCEAMAFAHARGVMHRDLKPANVMVGKFGETYVMDWGLARVLDQPDLFDLRIKPEDDVSSIATDRRAAVGASAEAPLRTMDDTALGTPSFMAPEQALGQTSRMGPQADVYAVGAMLYNLLAGRPPYQPETGHLSPRTVLELVQSGPPKSVAELSPETDPDLVAICERAMARDSERRYANMGELADDLRAWTERRPVRASPPAIGRVVRLWIERNRTTAVTAAFAVVALAVTSTILLLRVAREAHAKESAQIEGQRHADVLLVQALIASEGELWPARTERITAMDAWLASTSEVADRARLYRSEREALPAGDPRAAEIERVLKSVEQLDVDRARVESRRKLAVEVDRVSLVDHATDWNAALDRIRSSKRYAGTTIRPISGLVPLGPNAPSGLEEFWLVASGPRPRAEVISALDETAGIVLVLVPGGNFTMGSPLPQPHELEAPREVQIPAYFLAKHEVTQAQWLTVMDANPSRARNGAYAGLDINLRFPVETVSWFDCHKFCVRLAVDLPSQAQWEYAARADLFVDFGYGKTLESLRNHENVMDLTRNPKSEAAWEDGYKLTAPVGTFEANGFGIHDMLGNVSEWCRDEYQPLDPVQVGYPEKGTRAFRGGSFFGNARTTTRPSFVQWDGPAGANQARGLRVALNLDVP